MNLTNMRFQIIQVDHIVKKKKLNIHLIMIIQITIIMGIKNLINLLMKRKKIMDTNNLTNKNMMTILTNKAMSIIILFKEIMVDVQTVINVLKVNAVLNGDIAV